MLNKIKKIIENKYENRRVKEKSKSKIMRKIKIKKNKEKLDFRYLSKRKFLNFL